MWVMKRLPLTAKAKPAGARRRQPAKASFEGSR